MHFALRYPKWHHGKGTLLACPVVGLDAAKVKVEVEVGVEVEVDPKVNEVWPGIIGQISGPPVFRRQAPTSTGDDNGPSEEDEHTTGIFDEGAETDEDPNLLDGSYGQLLQSLNLQQRDRGTATKKRKLRDVSSEPASGALNTDFLRQEEPNHNLFKDDLNDEEVVYNSESEVEDAGLEGQVEGDDTEEADLTDPFESHFANPDPQLLLPRLQAIKDCKWVSTATTTTQDLRRQCSVPLSGPDASLDVPVVKAFESLTIKRRLVASGQQIWSNLDATEGEVASSMFAYRDVLFGSRTIDNATRLRELVVLHALNHVFKTRDRVIKNNAKLALDDAGDSPELRDQGFTRPKILFILPTRQACARFVNNIVSLSQPEQQQNKARFIEGFSQTDDGSWEDKPRDFQDLFGGNDDDMFRMGLKLTRKTVKFFAAFYDSDVILASPLGLRTAVESGGSKDGKKVIDADFLSSIEIVIMDHANALLMQNWQHVENIFSHLSLLPKESHGCDFSRVRNWYLDGEAKNLRQTIVLTDFITPEINSIYSQSMLNFAGKSRFTPIYQGAMLDVSASLSINITQTFLRLNAPTPLSDADVRFSHFASGMLPSLSKSQQGKGTLIFTSSYLDFVRLRNHFSSSPTPASLSFGAISEYTSVRDVARARSHFLTGRHSFLLYSERAHHFRRYKLRGVKRIIFYSLPENPIFWTEIVAALGPEVEEGTHNGGRTVRALFSRWDALKLERIVGTSRVGKMINDKAGDTFEFT